MERARILPYIQAAPDVPAGWEWQRQGRGRAAGAEKLERPP